MTGHAGINMPKPIGQQPPPSEHAGHDMKPITQEGKAKEHERHEMKTPAKMSAPKAASSKAKQKQLYTCEMHPEVVSDNPGDCPKCGMKLILKTDANQKHRH
jgi:hypothetical protein